MTNENKNTGDAHGRLFLELTQAKADLRKNRAAIAAFLASCTSASDNYVGGVERLQLEACLADTTSASQATEGSAA